MYTVHSCLTVLALLSFLNPRSLQHKRLAADNGVEISLIEQFAELAPNIPHTPCHMQALVHTHVQHTPCAHP